MSHDDMITIHADILQVTDAAVLRRKLHRCKEHAEMWREQDEAIAARLSEGAKNFLRYVGEKLVRRKDKRRVSDAIWTIIYVLESRNSCPREHCQYNNDRYPYSCSAGKRIHTCKDYDNYMRKKAFGAEICKECQYAEQTKKWGAVCRFPQNENMPEGCPRAKEAS